jgi:ParB-like chromosome segregation protein Spo0J
MSKREMTLEDWPIEKLIPYDKNAKKHPKEQIQKIARSIEKHGLINPLNVEPDGTLITGHGRLLALANILNWKVVPVFVRHDLTKQEAAAARLADNKVGEGDYDTNILQDELRWLEQESVDLSDLGFDSRELAFLTEDIGALDESLMGGVSFSDDLPDHADDLPAPVDDLLEARIPISKVIGVKDVTASQAREIGRLMDMIRAKHGDNPAIALASFAEHEVANA